MTQANTREAEVERFTRLLTKWQRHLFIYAMALLHDTNDAEEVLQETFINACRGAGDFEGRSSLGTWLYRIATNNGLMRLRRREAPTVTLDMPPNPQEEGEFWPRQLHDWNWEPESVALTDELRQAMDEAVATLPDPLRTVFVLRDLEGFSTKEAAEILDISPSNLKVRLHRARLMLRERLAAYFNEHPNGGEPAQ